MSRLEKTENPLTGYDTMITDISDCVDRKRQAHGFVSPVVRQKKRALV